MTTPDWASVVANMERLGYNLSLRYGGSPCYPSRWGWRAMFVPKGSKDNKFLESEGETPFGAVARASMKMLEARANTFKWKLKDMKARRDREAEGA